MGEYRIEDAGGENYGKPSDKANSKGSGTYNPQAKSADPINYSGIEDFGDARFSGGKAADINNSKTEIAKPKGASYTEGS